MHKRGISEIVSYVLLVSLAMVMAGVIFSWMKFYAEKPLPSESCPEVSIVIQDYFCKDKMLNLTVQNRGRFDIDGYIIKISNGTMFYSMQEKGSRLNYVPANLSSGEPANRIFNYSRYNAIKEIEIEAIKGKDKAGRPILCVNSVLRQAVQQC